MRLRIDLQHFQSDQESLTSLKATNPAGHRQPGAGNSSHSHTDITEPHTPLTRKGDRKAPKHGDGPSSSGLHQAPCPDDHRSGESMLQFNMFKRNPLFPRRLCSPNIMYVNANSSGLQKASNNRINAGIFRSKKLDRYSDGQFWVSVWLGQSPVIQPNTHLDVAGNVFCGCGSHPSSELLETRPP